MAKKSTTAKKADAPRPKPAGQPTRGPHAEKPPRKPKAKQGAAAPDLSYIAEGLRSLAEPIDSITPDPRNARAHDDRNLRAIATSLREYGQRRPVVVNRNGNLIQAGHGLVEAAKAIGWTHVAVLWVEDDPASHVGFSLADNRTAELAVWDDAMLMELVTEYGDDNADLFDQLLLSEIVGDFETGAAEASEPEPPKEVTVPTAWQILVELQDEDQQRELYERLTEEGYVCKIVNL